MISLAGRDILHSWGKFVFTGVGLGLLIGVTLIMAGVESLGGFMMMFAYNLASFADARRAVVANPERLPDANLVGAAALAPGSELSADYGDQLQIRVIMAMALGRLCIA